jgi:hypothetical protein
MAIWYILWSFGIFLPVLAYCNNKNLATLVRSSSADKLFRSNFEDIYVLPLNNRKARVGSVVL